MMDDTAKSGEGIPASNTSARGHHRRLVPGEDGFRMPEMREAPVMFDQGGVGHGESLAQVETGETRIDGLEVERQVSLRTRGRCGTGASRANRCQRRRGATKAARYGTRARGG